MRAMAALPAVITENLEAIRGLCREHHVTKLTVFGSAVKGTFDPERSDLDFVVELERDDDPMEPGRRYLELWKALKDLFGRPVDLLIERTIKNPYLAESIAAAQTPLYAAA
jgi:predicted nucleotidyltransferase